MNSLIKLDNPIKTENAIIDRIDITKINRETFSDYGNCYYIDAMTNLKYDKYLLYEDNNLYLVMEIVEEELLEINIKHKIQLEEQDIIRLITDYILYDIYIFNNSYIADKIKELENKIKEDFDLLLIFDTPGEIPIRYGILNNLAIFNRIYINNDKIVIAELVGKLTITEQKQKLTLCLENGKFISVDIKSENILVSNGLFGSVKYISITYDDNRVAFYHDAEEETDPLLKEDYRFEIKNPDTKLPTLDTCSYYELEKIANYFKENNSKDNINSINKDNKLPAMQINILDYMLG